MFGPRDDSFYSRRDSLPPVPEEENEQNETVVLRQNRRRRCISGNSEQNHSGASHAQPLLNRWSWSNGDAVLQNQRASMFEMNRLTDNFEFDVSLSQEEKAELAYAGSSVNCHVPCATDKTSSKRIGILLFILAIIIFIMVALIIRSVSELQHDVVNDPYCNCRCEDLKTIQECRKFSLSFGKFVQFMNSTGE